MWPSIGIRQKIFGLFGIIALVPLIVINVIWLRSAEQQVKQAAADRQSILLSSSAARVNESLDTKINLLVSTSQDQNIIDLKIAPAQLKLLQYANLSSDVDRVALIDAAGNERVVIENQTLLATMSNIKGGEAFKVVTEVSNEAWLSDVAYEDGQPKITVAVPLLNASKLGDQNLSSSASLARRFGSDITGALVVKLRLSSLWQSVLSAKLGSDGYAYIVDKYGTPIAYNEPGFIARHSSLLDTGEVHSAVKTLESSDLDKVAADYVPQPTVTTSEKGVRVLSSHFPISRARWAIIGQEPIVSVYGGVNRVSGIALLIFLVAIPLAILFIIFATGSIVGPIRGLTAEAQRMGAGDFDHPLVVRGHDELATLATTFNKMGKDLATLITSIQTQNLSLAAERSKLQAVLDTVADGVVVLNNQYEIVLANKTMATLTLASGANTLSGRPWLEVLELSYKDKPFENKFLHGKLLYFKNVTLKLGQQHKFLDVTAVQVYNDPTGIAYILTIHDITTEQELESMKVDFVSMAAHELRTPLTSIRGYLELISNQSQTLTPKQNTYLQRSMISSRLLANLINNLLNVSNIERGEIGVAWGKVDLPKVIVAVLRDQLMLAQDKGLTIDYEGPSENLWVVGDEVLLREVISNFVSNAIHYTDSGGVVVTTRVDGKTIITTIKDTGYGIPASTIPHLFTKFYRGHTTLTATTKGTGLGLYISKAIVTSHQGSVDVESVEGSGSTFSFTLPTFDEKRYNTLMTQTLNSVNKKS